MSSTGAYRYVVNPPIYRDNSLRIAIRSSKKIPFTIIYNEVEYSEKQYKLLSRLSKKDKKINISKVPSRSEHNALYVSEPLVGNFMGLKFRSWSVERMLHQMTCIKNLLKKGFDISNYQEIKYDRLVFFGFKIVYKSAIIILSDILQLKKLIKKVESYINQHGTHLLFPLEVKIAN